MLKRIILAAIAIATVPVLAAEFGLKAGLWQVRLVKQTVDGRDTTAQMAAALEAMKQAMANMSPEQRERMQAMMNQDSQGGFRICVSPEMAQRKAPVLDREGRCQPASTEQHGNTTQFVFSCTTNGTSMNGKGEAVTLGNVIKTHTELTSSSAHGTHQMQSESEMTYLGSDCGSLKPPAPPSRP